jgi:hypothetical protein
MEILFFKKCFKKTKGTRLKIKIIPRPLRTGGFLRKKENMKVKVLRQS